MSTSASARRGQFWRADGFVGVLVVVAVFVFHQAADFIGTLERPAVMGAHNAFVRGSQSAGQPGYDPAQRDDGLPGQAGQEPTREL